MVFFKNISIHIPKNLFYRIRKFIPDDVTESGEGRCFYAVQKIHIPDIITAESFDVSQGTDPVFHESKKYHFEELLFITSWTACSVAFLYKIS